MAIVKPSTILEPFATNGDLVTPPASPSATVANQDTGFPLLQSTPISAGGLPVQRDQMNGVINLYSQFVFWQQCGGVYTFDAAVSTQYGGYPAGIVLWCAANNSFQVSLINNNTANFIITPSYINDGIHWQTVGNNNSLVIAISSNVPDISGSPYYANGLWVIGVDGGIYYSHDGINWIISNINSGLFDNTTPYYANGIWVIGTTSTGGIYYSVSGTTWTLSNITTHAFQKAYYANSLWVIGCSGGSAGVYYSASGTTWTQSNLTSGNFSPPYYANGLWVIGAIAVSTGIYYSANGTTWTQSNITTGSFPFEAYYANGLWVIGSDGAGIYYSTNGTTWTQSNIITGRAGSPYYANGIWVIGTDSTGIYYSRDGMTWTQSNINSVNAFNANPYYANGLWVIGAAASATKSTIYYSTDGITWTGSNLISDGTSVVGMSSAYYANGIWVIGKQDGTGGVYYLLQLPKYN